MITGDALDYDRAQQEREKADRKLLELRSRLADEAHRKDLAAKKAADAYYADLRRHQEQILATIAAQAAADERARVVLGGNNLTAVRDALVALIDRVTALETKLATILHEPRS